jgi:hypothetical protein
MPSTKPPTIVQPGPGKLAAGQVPASALAFPISGGDVAAHVNDPVDAHMAGAIGIPVINPTTGQPLLSSAGGPYDGESVMDALTQISDLLPVKPDRVGFNNGAVPNSGITAWSNSMTVGASAIRGGFTKGGNGIVTKYLTPTGSTGSQTVGGIVYPADRGVLALYSTTNADFFNAGQTTLVAALWLGANPPPAGIPSANFVEANRTTTQVDYTATNVGIDRITLIDRLPYLTSYTGGEYSPYTANFFGYQLGKYSTSVTLVAGDSGSFLLVHWRESYASTLAAIQPAGLTALTLVSANCYSAIPADPTNYDNVIRANVFVDAQSGSAPSGGTITTSPTGTVTTQPLSGISYYDSLGFQVDITSTITNLFQNSYLTNTVSSVSVPAGYESALPPAQVVMSEFGGAITSYPLYDGAPSRIVDDGSGLPYTLVSPPALASTARFQHATHPSGTGAAEPTYPYSTVYVRWRGAFSANVDVPSTERYLYNSGFSSFNSETIERFCSETYRYVGSAAASSPALPILPAGGDDFDSTVSIPAGELQVQSGRLVYPSVDFTAAAYRPVNAARNYAAVLAGDAGNTKRRYVRAFNTGIARNTGRLRVTGLAFAAFDAGILAVDPAEITDHPGGAIVQIKVPGSTGWLDLGRADGVPDLNKSLDFRGCRTGIAGDVYSFNTGSFTADNGSGKFLIFVRVTLIKNGVGQTLSVQEVEWLPP